METKFVGKNRIFLPVVGSTNSYATELLKNVNLAEGTVVYTHHQTQGRGQRGMHWQAEPVSNLTFSIVLKPQFLALENYFHLYKIVALACYDALTEIINTGQFDIKIKWPNDILVNRKKICGILIENILSDNQLQWSIIGIGINVNQQNFDEKLNATSVLQILGHEYDTSQLLNMVCGHVEKYYLLLKEKQFTVINNIYLQHLFALNQSRWLYFKGERLYLKVSHVNSAGLLVLEDDNGKSFEADIKDINWLLHD